ncbi:hypothetical protein C8R45DRAFT_1184122 [Mycena sanguinolenta]|nr:hypothetical protein C8R45DRAFT_1184122 [Mycena sanguinolenta]
MYPSKSAPQGSSKNSRRRTIMACINCRKRKVKCVTTEQPPKNPCARCKKNGLTCQYVAAENDDDNDYPQFDSASPAHGRANLLHPPTQSQYWVEPPMQASSNFSREFGGTAPLLPRTGPPPPNKRPRYDGGSYPDLSLSGPSNQYTSSAQYHSGSPTPASNPMFNPGYNVPQPSQDYRSMPNYGTPSVQQEVYAPGDGGYPSNYRHVSYGKDMTMPESGWRPQ